MDDIHKSGIITGLQNLWSSSQYSDLIIRSGSEEFKVHRAIICPRSKFFAAACNGPFQEGKTGIITLQDDDTATVHRMLKYLYTLNYYDDGEAADVAIYAHGKGASADLQAPTVTDEQQLSALDPFDYRRIMNNIAVYAVADKYDIPELEMLAAKKFKTVLEGLLPLRDMASFRAIIDAVFDTTPDTKSGLRSVVIEHCKQWKTVLIANEHSAAILKDYGEIGLAMMHHMAQEHIQDRTSLHIRIGEVKERENTLIWHLEKISRVAKCMKVSNSREVQQNYIDAQHRRLKDLREAIQEAKDYYMNDSE